VPERATLHIAPVAFGSGGMWGGGERYPFELALAMSKKVPTRLLTFGKRHERAQINSLEIVTLQTRWHVRGNSLNPVSELFLSECLKAERLHTHQFETLLTTAAVCLGRVSGKHVFCTDHGGYAPNFGRRLGVGQKLNRFLAVSHFSAGIFPELAGKVDVIYGGVDINRFFPVPVDRQRKIVFVGRILPHKGIDILIKALPSNLPLHIYGRAYDEQYLGELKRLSQGKEVNFHSSASDQEIVEAYRTATMSVLPSVYRTSGGASAPRSELLGLALIEAMACGTPVIATRVGGMPEVVSQGEAGLLVEPGSVEELSEAINTLAKQGSIWRELSAAGLSQVRETFNWDVVVDKCLSAYEKR
jgi:glycosyltransferase involved in cell wall biosynthesis